MNWWFIAIIGLMTLNLGMALQKLGTFEDPRGKKFLVEFIATVIGFVLIYFARRAGF